MAYHLPMINGLRRSHSRFSCSRTLFCHTFSFKVIFVSRTRFNLNAIFGILTITEILIIQLQDTSEFNVTTSSLHALSNSMALTRSDKQSPHSSPRLTRRSITPNVNLTVSMNQTATDTYVKVRCHH